MGELSHLSSAMLKLKCVEFGSSPSLLSPASSDGGGSSGNDFYFYAGSKDGSEETISELTADSGLSSDTEGCTPPPSQRPSRKVATGPRSASSCGIGGGGCDDSQSDVSADSLADFSSVPPLSPAMARRTKKKKLPGNLLTEIRQKANEMQLVRQKKHLLQLQQQAQQQKMSQHGNNKNQHQHQHAMLINNNNNNNTNQQAPELPAKLRKSVTSPSLTRDRNLVLSLPAIPQRAESEHGDAADGFHQQRFYLREYQSATVPENIGQVGASFASSSSVNGGGGGGEDLSFVGVRDILNVQNGGLTIRSHKSGTVRGVRNRVRAGITTFLQGRTFKSWAEREQGKVIVYTTSMGVVRETYQRCQQVHRILGTLLINFEERDVSMNRQVQQELKERLNRDKIVIPQVFVEGQLLGDAEMIEKLNESGKLREILRRYKRVGPETVCDSCGGYRYLPCSICCGSKKSIHRNHFTAEFVALKCITCNEAGLVRCSACSAPVPPA